MGVRLFYGFSKRQNAKKTISPESLLYIRMYVDYLELYINILEIKCSKLKNASDRFQYCITLAILDNELESFRQMHINNNGDFKDPEEARFSRESGLSTEDRLRLYIRTGVICRRKFRLTCCDASWTQARGIEEAVILLLRIRKDIERSYEESLKKTRGRSFPSVILNWFRKKTFLWCS